MALTFFMVHSTLLIEKVVSIAFCIFINSIFMLLSSSAHSSKSESTYRQCSCNSAVRTCGTYFAGTSFAWYEPKEFPSCSATSQMISPWSAVTISCALLLFRKDTRYLLWLCAYCLLAVARPKKLCMAHHSSQKALLITKVSIAALCVCVCFAHTFIWIFCVPWHHIFTTWCNSTVCL